MADVSVIDIVSLAFVVLAFIAASVFMLRYQMRTRGHWRDTPYGVHLMVFSGACVAIFVYTMLSTTGVVPEFLRPWFRSVIFLSMAFLFGWRTVLLRDAQRVKKGTTDATE
jgi:amino acid transporter